MLDIKVYEDTRISQEGISEILEKVKSFFSNNKKPKRPKRKGKDNKQVNFYTEQLSTYRKNKEIELKEFEGVLKTFYLNNEFLDKQTFVKGNIAASDITKNFILDSKYVPDFSKAVNDNFNRLSKLAEYKKHFNDYIKQIEVIDDKVCKATSNLDPDSDEDIAKVDDILEKTVVTIMKIKSPAEYAKTLPKSYLPNLLLNVKTYDVFSEGIGDHSYDVFSINNDGTVTPNELPALDKEGVKEIAGLCLKVIEFFKHCAKWESGGSYEDDGAALRKFFDASSFMDTYYELTYYQVLWDYDLSNLEDGLDSILLAFEKYISRSIK